MQHVSPKSQPRRTVLWIEAEARYVWLDANERAVNSTIRAKKIIAVYGEAPAGCYNSPLAQLYSPDDFDAHSRDKAGKRARYHRAASLRAAA